MILTRGISDGHLNKSAHDQLDSPSLSSISESDNESLIHQALHHQFSNSPVPARAGNNTTILRMMSARSPVAGLVRRHSLDFSTLHNLDSPRTPRSPLSGSRRFTRSLNSDSPPMSSRSNKVSIDLSFDKIQYHELIGDGATSKVYRASLTDLGLSLAVKVIQIEAFTSDEVRNIEQEIRLTEALSHPNIIKIIGHLRDRHTISIFLPLFDQSLRQHLVSNHPISYYHAVQYAMQCADGLSYLHEQSIIHRDLKSENILVQKLMAAVPKLVITDFGEATIKQKRLESNIGTTEFRAPELITDTIEEIKYNEKVDIWSFGMVLYELITGHIPYHITEQQIDHSRILSQIKDGIRPVLDIDDQRQVIFTELIVLFEQCTQLKGSKRPSCQHIVKKLNKLAEIIEISS